MKTKIALGYILNRLKEPSTYAGIGVVAATVAGIANQAQGVASTFKEQGATAGAIAITAAIVAILQSEKKKPEEDAPIDAEFTDVTEKAKTGK
jgi:hypothetical protein